MTERHDSNGADELLTAHQAAAVATVSLRTLDRYQAEGHIVPVRLPGGGRRFRRRDVEALLSGPAPAEVSA
jgi:excisionase family DNA binding protein